jgi:GntR family transcriptional regulator / MocR family aminotransferase
MVAAKGKLNGLTATVDHNWHNGKNQFNTFTMVQLKRFPGDQRGANGAGASIYAMLRTQIADGTLLAGAAVPSTRGLAAELGVSRTTVTAAYEQLAAEGYLVTSPGRAARVVVPANMPVATAPVGARRTITAPKLSDFGQRVKELGAPALPHGEPTHYDFLYGAVTSRDFPTLAWRRTYQAVLLRQQHRLYYEAPEGDAELREVLQGYLRRARGIICTSEQIMIVQGSQHAIDLCARLLLNSGDAFAFEDPGYLMARRCFEASGARCLPVPVDAQGLDTSKLPQNESARLVYVTPSHQFPLGGVLPITRRQELLHWAQRKDVWILEDDYDGEFRYGQRPIHALQSIDGDARVIYIGTFSKALSPQLRLGYLVLPEALVPVFRQAKRLNDRHAPSLEQRVLASLLKSGLYERHVRRMRRENERRRAALLHAVKRYLPDAAQVGGTAAGLHVVLWLPFLRPEDEPTLASAAREVEVGIYPLATLFMRPLSSDRPRPAGFILGYASLTVEQIQQGIEILGTLLSKWPVKVCCITDLHD